MSSDRPSDRQVRALHDFDGLREDSLMRGDVYVEFPTPPPSDGPGERGVEFWQSQRRS